jgi:phenylalanyl-tRNA synthetase alpha chain
MSSDSLSLNKNKKTYHPLSLITMDIVRILKSMGFVVAFGPEMEDEWHNFDALNVAPNHPARDMQDTFWIKDKPGFVLRTHTSGVQIRYMEKNKPPFAMIAPGKVFRNESTDAGHEMQFHQLEGLAVGKEINVANLKAVLLEFFKQFLGADAEIRMRPSYFPFVEPGFEVDVFHRGRWFEVLGAGIVHPNVLNNAGIDPNEWQGFAFGFGLDRLLMIKTGIPDIRLLYQGDLRINQW